MKIALLAAANSIHTRRWANSLSRRGHRIELITMHRPLNGFDQTIRIHRLPVKAPWGYLAGNRSSLQRLVDSIGPDVLHAHYAAGYGTLGRKINFHPYVLSVWGSDVYIVPERSGLHRREIRKNLERADRVLSTSKCMATRTCEIAPTIGEVDVTPFGVDLDQFQLSTATSGDSHQLVIGTVKTLSPVYGLDLLIRGFAECKSKLEVTDPEIAKRLRLQIVGDGPQKKSLKSLAEKLNVLPQTQFLGARGHEEVPNLLSQMDIFVAASRQESFGVAVVEASAAGLPVLVTDVGGLPEVVVHGETGLIVPPEDPESIGEGLTKLCQDPKLRERLGIAGRQFVGTHYDWQQNVSLVEDIYRDVAGPVVVPPRVSTQTSVEPTISTAPVSPINVWLMTTGEPLPTDSESPRLLRTGLLAQRLVEKGHHVTWWTSSFDHSGKYQRCDEHASLPIGDDYTIELLHGSGYKRNVSLQRLRDHRQVADQFTAIAPTKPIPDVILCSLPTLELSSAAADYAHRHSVPLILDVRDMWPDIFIDVVPRWSRPLSQFALKSLDRSCRNACREAFAITGHAPGFVEWGLDKANRTASAFDRDFPFGYTAMEPTEEEKRSARAFWDERLKGHRGPIACFFGAIGKQFQFDALIDAAGEMPEVTFVLCGQGDQLPHLQSQSRDCHNVVFPGWVQRPEIWELMRRSAVALAPYRDSRDFQLSIPNKAIEYMAGGLPILTSISQGILPELLDQHGCCWRYDGTAVDFKAQLRSLLEDPRRAARGQAARNLFESRFTASKVYSEMVEYLVEIAQHHAERKKEPVEC